VSKGVNLCEGPILRTCGFRGIADAFKRTFFKPFVPDAKTRPVPEKYFALVGSLVEVDKQMTAERILTHHMICEHRELVESATHICRLCVQEYPHG
jgi:hypothetical protein